VYVAMNKCTSNYFRFSGLNCVSIANNLESNQPTLPPLSEGTKQAATTNKP
jgi:hypothetical protein